MFLTGIVSEQVLPILFGSGENGKSTMMNCLLGMLGSDYAMMAPPNFLAVLASDRHPTERADLFRKRLVVAMETGKGRSFDIELVKMLTGSDPIRARRVYENNAQFNPTHKIVLGTNNKPPIDENSHAIWRRIALINVNRIPEDRKDKNISEKLKREWPGILAWCVRGCLEWQKAGGLQPPDTVQESTKSYRLEEDIVGRFLDEKCITNPGADLPRTKSLELFEAFAGWAEGLPGSPMSHKQFSQEIRGRGYKTKPSNGIHYLGIGLRQE
jgi:putative DNA primase/helicase